MAAMEVTPEVKAAWAEVKAAAMEVTPARAEA